MRKKPAEERARGYLEAVIEQHRNRRQHRLPPTKVMCREAGVSPLVLNHALRYFRDKGVLTTRQGAGSFLTSGNSAEDPVEPAFDSLEAGSYTTTWKRVYDTIVNEIVEGLLPPGAQLPGMKIMSEHYGASYRPLKKALELLVNQKQLEYHRRHYRVPSAVPGSDRRAIVLVARGQRDGTLAVPTAMMADFLPSLQQHCIRVHCMLHVTPAYFRNDVPVFSESLLSLLDSPAEFDRIVGFVYFSDNLGAFDNRHMLARMAATGKPIALVDNEGQSSELIGAVPHKTTAVYTSAAGLRAGYLTGKYLIAEGHRHAAYITSSGHYRWSENRFAGLQQAFDAYNIPENLHKYSVDVTEAAPEVLRAGRQSKRFVKQLAAELTPAPHSSILESRLYKLENDISIFLRDRSRTRIVYPLLEEALLREETTVWVAENDALAATCLDFLRERAIAVPERIDIVGFDDSRMAICRSLSSYNFNMPALAGKIVTHLLYPSSRRRTAGAKHRHIEVDGFVSKRIPRTMDAR